MKRLLLLLIPVFLTACTTFNTETPSSVVDGNKPLGTHSMPWPKRQAQLMALQNWSAQGNAAAHTDTKGWNASYHWQQNDNNYSLVMFGPLGMDRIQISGTPGQSTLTTSAQKTFTANSPETLLLEQTGWSLPVSDLYYWLRGLPDPHGRFKRSFDLNNHIVHLYQNGWEIRYLRYISVNNIDLPHRIVLSNDQWQVRLVITQWQL
jgi:outer membrane lipoprotein LolB